MGTKIEARRTPSTAGDTPLRVAPGTKARVKWLAGHFNSTQGDVVDIAVTDFIKRYEAPLRRLGELLRDPTSDPSAIAKLRQQLGLV